MASAKVLADGRTKVTRLTAAPADPDAITDTEVLAGTAWDPYILSSDFKLGPSGSGTIGEKPLSVMGDIKVWTTSGYDGCQMTLFRYYDTTDDQPDLAADAAFQAAKDKGTTLYLVVRKSAKAATDAWEAGDEYSYFEVLTDDPQDGSGDGYIKKIVPLAVQNASLDKVIVAESA